ncbi:MAG: DUF4397 domain-containing protein [Aminipila sp.]
MKNPYSGYVRVLHAVPGAPNVDVYANDKLIAKNLAYGNYTDYMPLDEGTYKISLYASGDKSSPVLANMLSIKKDEIITVAASGTLKNIGFLAIIDSNVPAQNSNAMVRFAHLSPNAPAVDITLPDGTILFENVFFKQVTSYLQVPPSIYTLQVRLTGTPTVVLTVPDVELDKNTIYTIYAIGLASESPELQALLVEDSTVL